MLFPYAKAHARSFLESTYDSPATAADIALLRTQAQEVCTVTLWVTPLPLSTTHPSHGQLAPPQDVANGVAGAVPIPTDGPKEAVITACMANVDCQMAADRKTTALKALQGHVWHEGFAGGEIRGELFRDVPDALQLFRDLGIKTYIYSSGSRQAQRDLFGHTTVRKCMGSVLVAVLVIAIFNMLEYKDAGGRHAALPHGFL